MTTPKPRVLGKRPATLKDLKAKKAREDLVTLSITGDDGEPIEVTVRMKALSSRAYDALESQFPPTKEQREKGQVFNIDLFAPALIAASSVEPKLTVEDATELYDSEEWASGEIGGLFFAAQKLCNAGLDASFTVAG